MHKFQIQVDGKTILGGILIGSYMLLVNRLIGMPAAVPNADLIKDQLLVIGPIAGLIAGAIWRTTGTDERRTELLNNAFRKLPDPCPPPSGATAAPDPQTIVTTAAPPPLRARETGIIE